MATQIVKMVIQLRRDIAENWNLYKDIVPAAGEPCFVTDENILKIGDGVTTFENLKPIGGAILSADDKSIIVEDGVLKLMGFDAAEVGAQPRKAEDGGIEWVVPTDNVSLELKESVETLQADVDALKEILTPSAEGAEPLIVRVEALESQTEDLAAEVEQISNTLEDSIKSEVTKEVSAQIDDFSNKISDDGVVNTLKELVDYVANHGGEVETIVSDISTLQHLVGDERVSDQIDFAIANSGHITNTEAQSTFMSKAEAKAILEHAKYEITNTPAGTLVDYSDNEIRVMVPADTQWSKQTVGDGGNSNMYYMGFKAYAPAGAVSFKEGDRGEIVDEMLTFEDEFAGTDEFGRNYSICWFALASYDEASDTWNYFGKNSTANKYIGWTYVVEWYDKNGVKISYDKIRINLSNEDCHYNIEPYYMANIVKGVKVNGTILDIVDGVVDITIAEQTLGVKGSNEIHVAEDGTLSIQTISFSKIVQEEGEDIVFDGGGAAGR